jgi:hypothetical protein
MNNMEQTQSFTDQLFQAVMERQQAFDSFLLPKLQEEYRISQSAAKTIRTVLVKKGIMHDDPYKYDSKIQEIEIPPEDGFTDTEKASVIARRLSQYEAMLDFMSNYYQFTCDFLNPTRIGKLVALNHAFTWESFSNTSSKNNTKGLADLILTLRNGGDSLSVGIVNDALSQLSKSSIAITKALKNLAEFHKERYKLSIRKLVLPGAIIDPKSLETGYTTAMREIKRSFAVSMKDQPFYTELIEEVLKEDYSPDHAVLQQELIARLSSVKTDAGKSQIAENFKSVLMDGIRALGSVSPQIEEICGKLIENENVILSLEQGFIQKLARMFRKAFNRPEREQDIVVTTIDPITQTGKRETVKFLPFIEDLKKRARLYTGFTVRNSASYQKIDLMDEKQILDLLTRHVAEVGNILKVCGGLDDYFKQAAGPENRERIHGVKVEIATIRNSLVKANQCRAEYAAQVEEQQQLKKLGITNV